MTAPRSIAGDEYARASGAEPGEARQTITGSLGAATRDRATTDLVSTSEWSRAKLACLLCSFLEARGVSYVAVGDLRDLDSLTDLDVVVARESLPQIPRLVIQFCAAEGVQLVQVLQHEQNANYFVCSSIDGGSHVRHFAADFCGDFFHLGKRLLTAEALLANRTRRESNGAEGRFFVPAPAKAFAYYLTKRIDKGELGEREGEYLSGQWERDSDGASVELRQFWGPDDIGLLTRAASERRWEEVRARLPELRRAMIDRVRPTLRERGAEWRRRLRRVLHPTGYLVAVLGPDGVGKSTMLDQVERELAPAFRRTARYHLRPGFGRSKGTDSVCTDPHAPSSYGIVRSTAKLVLWWADYTIGYARAVLPRLVGSSFVLFDRYYYDLTVDPRRYRYGGPLSLAQAVGRLLPRPDLIVVLDAPAATVRARREELPLDEIVRQRQAYRRLVEAAPNACMIDASRPADEVATAVARTIIDRLAARTASRLGLADVVR
jgi:thymidylate kinase